MISLSRESKTTMNILRNNKMYHVAPPGGFRAAAIQASS
jgi:hypothetical protein